MQKKKKPTKVTQKKEGNWKILDRMEQQQQQE